ncbi:MAG: S8 family serine peptidase [Burkholderiales bacterium]|nr:S8 family serine peptidase [Burkholderiales bacterium]
MKRLAIVALAALLVAGGALAQAPKRIERAADLPRFTYQVEGQLEAIVRDPRLFSALAKRAYDDTSSVLATHDIAEAATRRSLLGLLQAIDLLEGRWDDALARAAQVRELQEKPADKLLSGITARAIANAAKRTGSAGTPAWRAEVGRLVAEELARMPWDVVRNDVLGMKAGLETAGEAGALGRVREVLQPVATRTGAISSDLLPALVGARYSLAYILPLKDTLLASVGGYVAANKTDKPDIWKARDVALPAGMNLKPVTIVVWDSGTDAPIFKDRWATAPDGSQAFIAFDRQGLPSTSPLKPIPGELRARLPQLQGRSKGLSDLTSNVDSPEATEVKLLLSNLAPAQYKPVIEELRLTSGYQHGTHVAGIAMAGNPYARLANARIDFGHTLLPDPCPTPELLARDVRNLGAYADFIRKTGARVVNMSWGGNVRGYEVALEQCGIGKDIAERKALARRDFDNYRHALVKALESLPDVLFVVSAGNSGNDPTFNEGYPSGIVLPNVVAVGAVDKAGDEAPFTSYGPTVLLHANGYQVESYVPGGGRLAISGTSMSAPQVTNLAAKMLAIKPQLKPQELVSIMRSTAERTADGRRTLIHPARALAAVGFQP